MIPLTRDVMSNICGSMSLGCWLIVYAPQIWENYQLQSGEGLSVAFIVLWLLGDLTGLAGSVMAGLIPSVVILASYYTVCDLILLGQVYYYRRYEKSSQQAQSSHPPSESSPLLPSSPLLHPVPSPPQPKPLLPAFLLYPALFIFILAAGLAGWFLSDNPNEVGIPEAPGKGQEVELEWKSQVLGWASALLYLGSRIPQIIHNFKTRCAGLSLALFFFTISGNITYSASILLTSTEPHYLLANLSWLVGALLTVFQDFFVMGQFWFYAWQDKQAAKREAEEVLED